MTQTIKTFTHPAVARARKEAAQECARIAAEVSADAPDMSYAHVVGIRAGAKTVEERIRHRFGLESLAKVENS